MVFKILELNFTMEVKDIKIYRMTHIGNIPHILQYGVVHSSSSNKNPNYISIGDRTLIDFRKSKTIKVEGKSITLGDFIPFYFGVRMPMLYVMQRGGNFVEKAYNPEDIVYVAISLGGIMDGDFEYYFTDGHATDFLTTYYTKDKINQLNEILDWPAIKAHIWSGDGIEKDLKRRKQAEFLVREDVPVDCIFAFVCYNEASRTSLLEMGIPEHKIKVFPSAYY